MCKKNYVQALSKELDLLNTTSNTYQKAHDTLLMFFKNKIILDSIFGLKNNEEFQCLPCIYYWLPKMHKIPSGARFIIAGKM